MQRLITNKIGPIVADAEMSGSISELGLRIMLGAISFTESGRAVDNFLDPATSVSNDISEIHAL